ncbi:expressed protein [Dictyostelium purpureum]|uniref:Expressed protein n=1 Tax=Dictyostelium purpureum TaxID=5786 RepID=F0Z6R9_DICPU|nr:uncharacterized protein DICPUDRAFT_96259 [Dictyostelium purpureum]EGC40313.1 expressed protein [Dictyostelium purpureum]|eukprot:XP_003283064.1 expressed protein [Dictyostelium purpureum]
MEPMVQNPTISRKDKEFERIMVTVSIIMAIIRIQETGSRGFRAKENPQVVRLACDLGRYFNHFVQKLMCDQKEQVQLYNEQNSAITVNLNKSLTMVNNIFTNK